MAWKSIGISDGTTDGNQLNAAVIRSGINSLSHQILLELKKTSTPQQLHVRPRSLARRISNLLHHFDSRACPWVPNFHGSPRAAQSGQSIFAGSSRSVWTP